MHSFENRGGLEELEELAPFKNQVNELRLQDKLGKQNFHEIIKKFYEALTDAIKNTSENLTKTLRESSIKNNHALENLNEQFENY